MQIASAGEQKPWYFILVTESMRLNTLVSKLSYGQNIQSCISLLVGICGL
jgi:hypothetical protein